MPKISALPGAPTPVLTDIFPEVHPASGGTTYQATFQQLMVLYQQNIVTPANGGIVYTNATQLELLAPTATANQVLMSGSNTAPLWSTAVYPVSTTINQLLYSSSANVVAGLTTANNGVLVTSNTGVPSLLANSSTPGYVLTANSGAPPSWQATAASSIQITGNTGGPQTGNVFTFSGASTGLTFAGNLGIFTLGGVLGLNYGGTGANLSANIGGIVYSGASAFAVLAGTATAGQMLQSGSSAAPSWSTAIWPATTTVNQLLYSSSANTVTGLATANSAALVTNSIGVPIFTSTMTNGQVVIGSTGSTPAAATLTAGDGISITNAAGSITIAATGSGSDWSTVTTNTSMVIDHGYIINGGSQLQMTLPVTSAAGSVINIRGLGAGGYIIKQNAGQNIVVSSGAITTTGTGGSVASAAQYDTFDMTCIVANTTWSLSGIVSQGLTVV